MKLTVMGLLQHRSKLSYMTDNDDDYDENKKSCAKCWCIYTRYWLESEKLRIDLKYHHTNGRTLLQTFQSKDLRRIQIQCIPTTRVACCMLHAACCMGYKERANNLYVNSFWQTKATRCNETELARYNGDSSWTKGQGQWMKMQWERSHALGAKCQAMAIRCDSFSCWNMPWENVMNSNKVPTTC